METTRTARIMGYRRKGRRVMKVQDLTVKLNLETDLDGEKEGV